MIPFGEYAPDQPDTDTPYAAVANNVTPELNSYSGVAAPVSVSNALPSVAKGAFNSKLLFTTIIGTNVKIFKLISELWTDISRTTNYTVGTNDYWSFVGFGNYIFASNGKDEMQQLLTTSATNFSDLPAPAPIGRYMAVVKDFVVVANIPPNNTRQLRWSAINDPINWQIGSNSSGIQTLPDGGNITGITSGENGYVFQENAITRMTFVSSRSVFRFDKISVDMGCISPRSISQHSSKIFFLGTDGFYLLENDELTPIGDQKVDETLFKTAIPDTIDSIFSAINPDKKIVIWFIVDGNNTYDNVLTNKVFIYNWGINKWSTADIVARDATTYITNSVSPDTMITTNIDEFEKSFDDISDYGEKDVVAIINSNGELASLSGSNLEAEIDTGYTRIDDVGRAFVSGVVPISDSNNAQIKVDTKEYNNSSVSIGEYNSIEDNGVVPAHASGKLVNITIKIPANQEWKSIQGVTPIIKGAGNR